MEVSGKRTLHELLSKPRLVSRRFDRSPSIPPRLHLCQPLAPVTPRRRLMQVLHPQLPNGLGHTNKRKTGSLALQSMEIARPIIRSLPWVFVNP